MKSRVLSKHIEFCTVLTVLLLILLINRVFPYLLHGPFGFGYDLGIYKSAFEQIKTFSDVVASPFDLIPSFTAFIFHILNIPTDFLTYHLYVFLSVFIAIPLYFLTKEYFGKKEAIVAITIFTVSYVQVLASEFYLFKTMLGAIFMLYAFLFYSKKSYLFYLFFFLTALTQLPHIFLLTIGVFFDALFNLKKSYKFNLLALIIFSFSFLILFFFKYQQLTTAINIVIESFRGVSEFNINHTGLFMSLKGYLPKGFIILIFGLIGLFLTKNNKKILAFQISTLTVILIVFLQLFFHNRYIIEMDLFLIPFAAYTIVYLYGKRSKTIGAILLILISIIGSYCYYKTTNPALTNAEITALNLIHEKQDSQLVMVTNDYYSPWVHGFTAKTTLAPQMFNKLWTTEEWLKYHFASEKEKAETLVKIANKYGDYYLFEGHIQDYPDLSSLSQKIEKTFEENGVKVYKITNL